MAKNLTITKKYVADNATNSDNSSNTIIINNAPISQTTGGVSGSGTIGKLPKFTSASALGDSFFSDDGTTPKYNGGKIWTENNDGASSGLDADTLRGLVPQTSVTDATAGRLMRVGAFGLGGNSVPLDSIDVDDISVNLNGYCSSCTNTPLGANGFIRHNQINSDYATQIFVVPTDPINILGRNKTAGVWSSWVTIYHSGNSNLPTVDWIADNLTFNNALKGNTAFVDGYAGSGMKLWKDGSNKYSLTLDNLTIRGAMNVYELLVNKIRATNGSLFVTDSGKIKSVSIENDGNNYYHIYLEDTITLQAGDLVKCQVFTGNGVKLYILLVNYVNTSDNSFTVYLNNQVILGGTGNNIPVIGDTLVRIGSNTDTNRQGNIYLTNSDANAPYLQITDGVTSSNLNGDPKVRLGKLDGITDSYFGALSGYGLYSNNAYLLGYINSQNGKIANFTINTNSISSDSMTLNSNNTTGNITFQSDEETNNFNLQGLFFNTKNTTTQVITSRGIIGSYYSGGKYYVQTQGDNINLNAITSTNITSKLNILNGSDLILNAATNSNDTGDIVFNSGAGVELHRIYASTSAADDSLLYRKDAGTAYKIIHTGNTASIVRPTSTLSFSTSGAWSSFSSQSVNTRGEGKTYVAQIIFYASNSSASWQRLGSIVNYISPGYSVYFTVSTGSGTTENSAGYIGSDGVIYIQPGKGGQTYYGQATWIVA